MTALRRRTGIAWFALSLPRMSARPRVCWKICAGGEKELPETLNECVQEGVARWQQAKAQGTIPVLPPSNGSEYIPLRLTKGIEPGKAFGTLKAEVVAGRGLWLFSIKHTLTSTLRVLHQHRWSILTPPDGLSWFTSDDPVIRLNYCADGRYDFRGGWGNPGTEILLPLSGIMGNFQPVLTKAA